MLITYDCPFFNLYFIFTFLTFDHFAAPRALTLTYNFFLFFNFLFLIVSLTFFTVFFTRIFLNFFVVEICT